ncbi:hypothetical protein BV20DRAFT_819213 [Pilatotrama ljubarskyi]|nr:hypothetical protein BV20DRAFT_819213 [Pilatotrama ljubarskyi]
MAAAAVVVEEVVAVATAAVVADTTVATADGTTIAGEVIRLAVAPSFRSLPSLLPRSVCAPAAVRPSCIHVFSMIVHVGLVTSAIEPDIRWWCQ